MACWIEDGWWVVVGESRSGDIHQLNLQLSFDWAPPRPPLAPAARDATSATAAADDDDDDEQWGGVAPLSWRTFAVVSKIFFCSVFVLVCMLLMPRKNIHCHCCCFHCCCCCRHSSAIAKLLLLMLPPPSLLLNFMYGDEHFTRDHWLSSAAAHNACDKFFLCVIALCWFCHLSVPCDSATLLAMSLSMLFQRH